MTDDQRSSLLFLAELDRQFVKIPAGSLPPRPGGTKKVPVEAFETTRYPVTRALWQTVMGRMPDNVPQNQRETWDQCPDCPVNYVSDDPFEWYNKITPADIPTFMEKLNQRTKDTGCTYHLPSLDQLRYSILGDMTGETRDKYSKGITDRNVDQYVTHGKNSTGRIQPVGQKKLNAFGIELGNIWKISKDPYFPNNPKSRRAVCGGSWDTDISNVISVQCVKNTGFNESDGFILIRTCH